MSVRIRRCDGPDRNPQLSPGEVQVEGDSGAVAVRRLPTELIRITAMRGVPSRQANWSDLNLEQAEAFQAELAAIIAAHKKRT